MKRMFLLLIIVTALAVASRAYAEDLLLRLGPEELVEAGAADIDVFGYSVPSVADWNNDGINDLIVGEGGGGYSVAKVCVYINEGTQSEPLFSTFSYAQSGGGDLTCLGSGCLGCFPRVVYWNDDAKKDLLVGQADGQIKIFLNTGTDDAPTFDGGELLEVGEPGSKTIIDVQYRATPCLADWNNDGLRDLVVGSRYGRIYLYINEGTDTAPDYRAEAFVQQNGADLDVPSDRSSPVVLDLDGDGKKDILSGNTNGQLFFYTNTGTDEDPNFAGYEPVKADGVEIDLAGTPRSRPFVCDWTGDGYMDVLIGASDGKAHLYQSIPQTGDMDKDYDVDWNDFAIFAMYWGQTCETCAGADIVDDDIINMLDVLQIAENWLEGCE